MYSSNAKSNLTHLVMLCYYFWGGFYGLESAVVRCWLIPLLSASSICVIAAIECLSSQHVCDTWLQTAKCSNWLIQHKAQCTFHVHCTVQRYFSYFSLVILNTMKKDELFCNKPVYRVRDRFGCVCMCVSVVGTHEEKRRVKEVKWKSIRINCFPGANQWH